MKFSRLLKKFLILCCSCSIFGVGDSFAGAGINSPTPPVSPSDPKPNPPTPTPKPTPPLPPAPTTQESSGRNNALEDLKDLAEDNPLLAALGLGGGGAAAAGGIGATVAAGAPLVNTFVTPLLTKYLSMPLKLKENSMNAPIQADLNRKIRQIEKKEKEEEKIWTHINENAKEKPKGYRKGIVEAQERIRKRSGLWQRIKTKLTRENEDKKNARAFQEGKDLLIYHYGVETEKRNPKLQGESKGSDKDQEKKKVKFQSHKTFMKDLLQRPSKVGRVDPPEDNPILKQIQDSQVLSPRQRRVLKDASILPSKKVARALEKKNKERDAYYQPRAK